VATDVDLVLVNPGGRARIYQSLATELAAVEPPVWAGLMASFVRGRGHSVAILEPTPKNSVRNRQLPASSR
jgi:hypothetical protein